MLAYYIIIWLEKPFYSMWLQCFLCWDPPPSVTAEAYVNTYDKLLWAGMYQFSHQIFIEHLLGVRHISKSRMYKQIKQSLEKWIYL